MKTRPCTWSRLASPVSSKIGAGNCCVVERAVNVLRVANGVTPSSVNARRFTSANRTCRSTCWLPPPPGSCSMLMMVSFGALACATSAARRCTALLDTRPDRITEPSV